ncbi:DUF3164 family protein [Paucibacter sp. TC2R-5]|uniref:DUF3164 family protein n=1 Tax=Paucibacter sp. TC2R-5 TaxID=2893555 RepID=UPI0021E50EB7|nr:DUF3164 family protein [Paucibacter sp. TC2R-5]MCV2359655.1 DUF3164 family protein [Paucibacter sp. TC2R-5]
MPKGYWQDANGALIPLAKIKDIDKARHRAVTLMVDQALKMSTTLAQFKAAALAEIEAFVQLSAAEYDTKLGGKKGNITLVSFDGRFKVLRAMQETIVFDERLQVAKSLIDECVHLWAKGASKNIQALINHAFQVDKEGKVSTARVLSLRQLDIQDDKWSQAMEAIADSMKTASSKAYLRFYQRVEATGEYVAIPLDVSAT